MPYITLDLLKKRISEKTLIDLTDDLDLGVINEEAIDDLIAGVDELIDGHLRGKYDLPLTIGLKLITKIALDICVYECYGLKPEFGTPEAVEKKYTNQIKLLADIKKGEIKLGDGAEGTPPAETPADGILVSTGDKMFSKDTLDRY